MPIEFNCSQCGKLLRTPDETAGKQAKCPDCGGLTPVPETSPGPAPPGDSPFSFGAGAAPPSKTEPAPTIDTSNPYASSVGYSPETGYGSTSQPSAAGKGELRHDYADFSHVLSVSWAAFSAQLGWSLLFGLIAVGIGVGMYLILLPLILVQNALIANDQIAAALGVIAAQQFIPIPFAAVAICLGLNFGLNVLRGSHAPFDGLFSIGHCYLPVLGFQLLYVLLSVVCFGLGQGVIVYASAVKDPTFIFIGIGLMLIGLVVFFIISFRYLLTPMFVVERRMRLFEALNASSVYMVGNKLTAFLLMLVVGIAGGMFSVCTCYLGLVAFIPYYAIAATAFYLAATGQYSPGTRQK